MKRRRRRTDCTRGRLLDLHDRVRPGVTHKVETRFYISREAKAEIDAQAARLGVTENGLTALIIEAVTARGLIPTILQDFSISNQEQGNAVNH